MHKRIPSSQSKRNAARFSAIFSKEVLSNFDDRENSEFQLKQSIKKQIDRRNKLRKLLDTFIRIEQEQKKNSRFIKCSMIELKDSPTIIKSKIQIDPEIFVVNHLKPETRQFLSILLNTFYNTYNKQEERVKSIKEKSEQLGYTIRELSSKQDKIFNIYCSHIQSLAAEESKLHKFANQIKILKQAQQKLKEEQQPLLKMHTLQQTKNRKLLEKISYLEQYLLNLQQKNTNLTEKMEKQEKIKKQLWGNFLEETMYNQKLEDSVIKVESEIKKNSKKFGKNIQNLIDLRVKNNESEGNLRESFKGCKVNSQNSSISLKSSCDLRNSRILGALSEVPMSNSILINNSDFGRVSVGQQAKNKIKFVTNHQFSLKSSMSKFR